MDELHRHNLAVGAAAIAAPPVAVVALLRTLHHTIAAHSKGRLHRDPHRRSLYIKGAHCAGRPGCVMLLSTARALQLIKCHFLMLGSL